MGLGTKPKSKLSPGWAFGLGCGAGGWYIPRLGVQLGSSCAGEPRPSVAIPFHSLVETGWLSLPGSVPSQPRERKPFTNYNNRSTCTEVGGGHTLHGAVEGAGLALLPPTDCTATPSLKGSTISLACLVSASVLRRPVAIPH